MNKGQLVEAISRDAAITKTQAQAALDAFVKNVQKSLKGGDKVTIVGFGTFSASTRAARMGRNPQTIAEDSGGLGQRMRRVPILGIGN